MADNAASGLQAAFLLARGRAEGLQLIATDLPGAARSFRAMLICLPAFVCLRLIDWSDNGVPEAPAHALALDLTVYVIGWVGYALLSQRLLMAMGRGPRWPHFISAWNWCNVVQYVLMLAAELPGWLGAPDWVGQFIWIVALCWSIWLEWYATRLTLVVSPLLAALPVTLDLVFGIALNGVAGS